MRLFTVVAAMEATAAATALNRRSLPRPFQNRGTYLYYLQYLCGVGGFNYR